MKQALLVIVSAFIVWLGGGSAVGAEPGVDARTVEGDTAAPNETVRRGENCKDDAPRFIAHSKISVQRLIGSRVINPIEEHIGAVSDLTLDKCGRARVMVLRIGGLMGFGARYARVSLNKVRIEVTERNRELVIIMRQTRDHIFNEYGTLHQNEKFGPGNAGLPSVDTEAQ